MCTCSTFDGTTRRDRGLCHKRSPPPVLCLAFLRRLSSFLHTRVRLWLRFSICLSAPVLPPWASGEVGKTRGLPAGRWRCWPELTRIIERKRCADALLRRPGEPPRATTSGAVGVEHLDGGGGCRALLCRIERIMTWPQQVLCNKVVFVGKSTVQPSERPISLTSGLYRLWTKLQKSEVCRWEGQAAVFWDRAEVGSCALRSALARELLHHVATQLGGGAAAECLL